MSITEEPPCVRVIEPRLYDLEVGTSKGSKRCRSSHDHSLPPSAARGVERGRATTFTPVRLDSRHKPRHCLGQQTFRCPHPPRVVHQVPIVLHYLRYVPIGKIRLPGQLLVNRHERRRRLLASPLLKAPAAGRDVNPGRTHTRIGPINHPAQCPFAPQDVAGVKASMDETRPGRWLGRSPQLQRLLPQFRAATRPRRPRRCATTPRGIAMPKPVPVQRMNRGRPCLSRSTWSARTNSMS